MNRYVYLAGPIMGQTKDEANNWRKEVDNALAAESFGMTAQIIGVSPLRCEPIIGERYLPQYEDERFGTSRAIGSKNFFDVRNCDLTLAYLPKPAPGRHQSYGTIIELAWAYALGKPAIVVTDDPDVANHPVVQACAGWLLTNLDDAVDTIVGILGGYTGGKNV
jgi:nucleoside 2-deoxyribosyltransferase